LGYGGWGIGDWGLGIGPNPQSPIPNPQSPIPKQNLNQKNILIKLFKINLSINKLIKLEMLYILN